MELLGCSPPQALPDEILVEILLRCFPYDRVASGVCRHWKAVYQTFVHPICSSPAFLLSRARFGPLGPVEAYRILPGHAEVVTSICRVDHEEIKLASTSFDRSIRLWTLTECVRTIKAHLDWVYTVSGLTPRLIGSAAADNTAKVWDVGTGELKCVLEGHENDVTGILPLADGRVSTCSWDGTIKFWDIETGACLGTMDAHEAIITHLSTCYIGEFQHLVSCSYDNTVRVWDPVTENCVLVLEHEAQNVEDYMTCLVGLGSGLVAIGSNSGHIKVWDLDGKDCWAMSTCGKLRCISSLAQQNLVACGFYDGTIEVWDCRKRELCAKRVFSGARVDVRDMALLEDGNLACGGGEEVRIFKTTPDWGSLVAAYM